MVDGGGLGLRSGMEDTIESAEAGGGGAAPQVAEALAVVRAVSVTTLAETERVAGLSVRSLGAGFVLTSVTYVDQGLPTRAPAPATAKGAMVAVRALDEHGDLRRTPFVVSAKAESVGGVALSASPFDANEVALAWVGRDAALGQVFLTRLGRTGEKLAQRMLTRSKGGCSDVALAPAKGGWIAAWLDGRDGHTAVYAAKVGRELDRVGDEHKIADTKGEPSEVRLVPQRSEIVLAWREAREEPGASGIFATRVASDDLTVRVDPTRILRTSRSASSLQVARAGDGLVFGWVQMAENAPGSRRGVAMAWVDASLRSAGEPKMLAVPVDASGLALDCDAPQSSSACRVVISGGEGEQLALYGSMVRPAESNATSSRLAVTAGPSTEDTSPVLLGDRLFFAEDDLHGSGRIRVAQLVWR
jgi:hypothetical protein